MTGIGDKTVEVLRAAAASTDPATGEPSSTWGAIERAARGELDGIASRTRGSLSAIQARSPARPARVTRYGT